MKYRPSTSSTSPTPDDDFQVEEIEAFAIEARQDPWVNPRDVDDALRLGSRAFLARHYDAARRIFGALLQPVGECTIYLGQDQDLAEVLDVDLDTCAAHHVVATYMTAPASARAHAVLAAIRSVDSIRGFSEPLRELQGCAVEPLPDFDDFVVAWREVLAQLDKPPQQSWLRELIVHELGPGGLATRARQSRHVDDLNAWCDALVEARDWAGARAAYDEAASLVEDNDYHTGAFLDGVALAAQELGAPDLDAALERAWRRTPCLVRLQRWLGCCTTREDLVARASIALEGVSDEDARQRALLHTLRAELEEAATLLASADGLGWSSEKHPGHLMFPLFIMILGGEHRGFLRHFQDRDDDHAWRLERGDPPKLRTASVEALLKLAGMYPLRDATARAVALGGLRAAAERRMEAVTDHGRRSTYEHAASLAIQYVRIEGSPQGEAWLKELTEEYERYPALLSELRKARGGRFKR